ncbi:MAG: molybdopterin molybdenumtransferase MoeA, partial [Lachnospiraceae bacterium]|nr:molybdopterin molybdenumtransferase MoeA [Lachnospiraceae bacterium]
GKIVLGLSGNPMSSVTTFYAVCLPAIKKMMGNNDFENKYFKVKLKNSFSKKIKGLRFLRGVYEIENGRAVVNLNSDQGNIVIKSFIGCNAMVKVENVDEVKEGMEMDCMII